MVLLVMKKKTKIMTTSLKVNQTKIINLGKNKEFSLISNWEELTQKTIKFIMKREKGSLFLRPGLEFPMIDFFLCNIIAENTGTHSVTFYFFQVTYDHNKHEKFDRFLSPIESEDGRLIHELSTANEHAATNTVQKKAIIKCLTEIVNAYATMYEKEITKKSKNWKKNINYEFIWMIKGKPEDLTARFQEGSYFVDVYENGFFSDQI